MTTWVIGDVHGCSEELAQLIHELPPGRDDQLVSVGDLFHRGPDPISVMEVFREARGRFILGNHERKVLARLGLAPRRSDGSDRPPARADCPALEASDLEGDGRRVCAVPPERRADLARYLQTHDGFFLEQGSIPGAARTPDGRAWCVVHAGLVPGHAPRDLAPDDLVSLRRLPGRGRPFWYEVYRGEHSQHERPPPSLPRCWPPSP
jgi:hypothetical protein